MLVSQLKAPKHFLLTAVSEFYVRLVLFLILFITISIDSYFSCFFVMLLIEFGQIFLGCKELDFLKHSYEIVHITSNRIDIHVIIVFRLLFCFSMSLSCEKKLRYCFKLAGELTQNCLNMRRWIV